MSEITNWALAWQKITAPRRYTYHGLEKYGKGSQHYFRGRLCVLDSLASAAGVQEIDAPFVHERVYQMSRPLIPMADYFRIMSLPSSEKLKITKKDLVRDWRNIQKLYRRIRGLGGSILGNALQKYTFDFNHIPSSQIPEFVRYSSHEVIVTGIIQIKTEFGSHAFHAKTDPRGQLRSISERGKLLKMYPDTQAMMVSLLPKS